MTFTLTSARAEFQLNDTGKANMLCWDAQNDERSLVSILNIFRSRLDWFMSVDFFSFILCV